MAVFCLFLPSCSSINKLAMNLIADALTGDSSSDVFTGDPDAKLVGDALPFAIKMYESLLSANPTHHGLMLTTGSLFVMYANAFVQGPAEMLPSNEYDTKKEAMARSKQLYLRGYKILTDALEAKYPGFIQEPDESDAFKSILQKCKKDDVSLLYWTVAGGLAAYSIDIMDFELSANIFKWSTMIHRAYELDSDYSVAALDEFLVLFYASLPALLGGDIELAKEHFKKAQEKTDGNSVSAYVSYVQAICIPEQDYDTFRDYLEKALDINPDDNPSTRLVNIITQKKARWLLDNDWTFFSFLPIPDDY